MIAPAAELGAADVASPVLRTISSPETMLPTGSTTLLQKDRS